MGGIGFSSETSVKPIEINIKISVKKTDEGRVKELLEKAWDNAVLDDFEGSPLNKDHGGKYALEELCEMPVQEYMLKYLNAFGVSYKNFSKKTNELNTKIALKDKIKSAEDRVVNDERDESTGHIR